MRTEMVYLYTLAANVPTTYMKREREKSNICRPLNQDQDNILGFQI
jgi:hypothetical protein